MLSGATLLQIVPVVAGLIGQVPAIEASVEALINMIRGHAELTAQQQTDLEAQLATKLAGLQVQVDARDDATQAVAAAAAGTTPTK